MAKLLMSLGCESTFPKHWQLCNNGVIAHLEPDRAIFTDRRSVVVLSWNLDRIPLLTLLSCKSATKFSFLWPRMVNSSGLSQKTQLLGAQCLLVPYRLEWKNVLHVFKSRTLCLSVF